MEIYTLYGNGEEYVPEKLQSYIKSGLYFGKEKLAMVSDIGNYGFLKSDGTLLCEDPFPFYSVKTFKCGVAKVELCTDDKNKFNFLKPDGTLLFKRNYLSVGEFYNDIAYVWYGGYNYITKHEKFIYPDYILTQANDCSYGVCWIRVGNVDRYIDTTGLLSFNTKEEGLACIRDINNRNAQYIFRKMAKVYDV